MGQKVNPQAFRLGVSQPHLSHWFAKNKEYSKLLAEDHFLRESISKKFVNAGIDKITIERQVDTMTISISSARPRQLVGSFNKDQHLYTGIQSLREQLTKELQNYRKSFLLSKQTVHRTDKQKSIDPTKSEASAERDTTSNSKPATDLQALPVNISIHLTKLSEAYTSAACLAEFIVEQLEKRIPFRRAMKQAVLRAQKANVKGIKVQIAGRLNGAEIAKSEWILKGRVPLHTLRAKVQYSSQTARTIYGLLGVKVWVFTE